MSLTWTATWKGVRLMLAHDTEAGARGAPRLRARDVMLRKPLRSEPTRSIAGHSLYSGALLPRHQRARHAEDNRDRDHWTGPRDVVERDWRIRQRRRLASAVGFGGSPRPGNWSHAYRTREGGCRAGGA